MAKQPALPKCSRRHFLLTVMNACLAGACSPLTTLPAPPRQKDSADYSGNSFDLTIGQTPVNLTGEPHSATTINGSIPGPTLIWQQGEEVVIRVINLLDEETSLHWHGIILPYQMDGAPAISFSGIAPGATFTYRFKVQQAGTYWYHSHSGMQEQTGLYGAIVIKPEIPDAIQVDRDYVVMLSDWTDEAPLDVFAKLKKESGYYNMQQPTLVELIDDAANQGVVTALKQRHMWNMMRMNRTDLADISALTYTYLLNGRPGSNPWFGIFKPGEKVRLRFINASAQSFFDVRIPGLSMTVIAADGQNVEPVSIDEFRIGLAETYDVIIQPEQQAYSIFAQAMDRSGFIHGTLATSTALKPTLPALDKAQTLSMQDMMGAMQHGEDHGGAAHQGMMHHNMHHAHQMMSMPPAPPAKPSRHAETEYGANVDMRVDTPRANLDDPGVGLRNNGRRVLTYADLRTIGGSLDPRQPGRDIELHLTGNMQRYMWSFDGVEYADADSLHFHLGERLRIIVVNDTMMAHPIHLHGMWSDLENEQGEFQVRKHTLVVQPAQRLSFRVTADAPGRWPLHCHLFYHMHSGMFRDVVVS